MTDPEIPEQDEDWLVAHPSTFKRRSQLFFETFPIQSPGIFRGYKWEKLDNYDPASIDFLNEGTGRRVAYDDFSTIGIL